MMQVFASPQRVKTKERNEFGCALRFQTGANAVKNFAAVVANMSPELRAAFEAERAARQAELDSYVEAHGYRT
ncbi:MAG TPA: hypothetical protein VFT66_21925 [Roseiflexaceae bacterium]|jgi:hypothetical protein|nr:hypothetical protein [Roseiflexaceae bacterium]